MDLSFIVGVSLLSCFLLGRVNAASDLSITYNGQTMYKVGTNATFQCLVEPTPGVNVSHFEVSWSKANGINLEKIGSSSVREGGTFIYESAPASLAGRFSMSSDQLADGIATATVAGIKITDVSNYACGVDDIVLHANKMTSFSVSVYQIPEVFIEDVEVNLDIRPKVEEPPTVPDEVPSDSTNSTSEETNTTTTTTTTTTPTTTTTAVPADDHTTLAVCNVANSYPKPLKIEFKSSVSGHLWIVEPADFDSVQENTDGSFNVTARLRIKPFAELDGNVISCSSYYMENTAEESSNTTSTIVVQHLTQTVSIHLEPSHVPEGDQVTITCIADGNPSPSINLKKPSGDQIPYDAPHTFISQRDSHGNYTCIASNDDGVDVVKDSKALVVQYMDNPTIVGPTVVDQGKFVELECRAESNVVVSYKWTKGGDILSYNRKLTLTDVNGETSGIYTCEATGKITKEQIHDLTVNVGCIPKITKIVSTSTTNADAAHVKVTCTAEGTPRCEMSLTPKYAGAKIEQEYNKVVQVIEEFPKQTSPYKFTCSASNALSSNNKTIMLDDEKACCLEPPSGGSSSGVVVAIIIVILLILVAGGVCYYCYKKRLNKKPATSNEKPVDDAEAAKLTTPAEENNA